MKSALLAQILLVGFLLALFFPTNVFHVAAAPSYLPGVRAGDTMTYGNVTSFWQSNATLSTVLNGAGSTFVSPLVSAMSSSFSKINPSIQINYQAIGSGAGVNALIAKTTDFSASDAPLTDAQRAAAPNSLHVPETVGAVVVAYNVQGLSTGLKMNATVIARIFQGNITMWNDSAIAQLNPTLNLPNQAITVVHRSDASGTTFVFTSYLNSAANGVWTPGQGTTIPWPVGLGAFGNQGVAGVIQGTPNTIGYLELNYASANNISLAYLRNADGNNFVQPSLTNVAFAVTNSSSTLPMGNQSWATVSLLNAHGGSTYPIVSFSYLLVYKELNVIPGMTQTRAKALVNFLWYVVHGGQQAATPLNYVPLPPSTVGVDQATIMSITFNGQNIFQNSTISVQPSAIIDVNRSLKQFTIGITLNNTADVPSFNGIDIVLHYSPRVLSASSLDYSTNVFSQLGFSTALVRNCLDGIGANGNPALCGSDDGPGVVSFAETVLGGSASPGTSGNIFFLTLNANTTSPSFSLIQISTGILSFGNSMIPTSNLGAYYSSLSCGATCTFPPPNPAPPPSFIAEFLNVQSVHIEIQSISSGNIVNALETITYNNGTSPQTLPLGGNVANGSGLNYWIVSSGLTTGDPIYNTPTSPTVVSTTTETFAGVQRQVVHAHTIFTDSGSGLLNLAWDQSTGVLVSLLFQFSSIDSSTRSIGSSIASITSTSLWGGDFGIQANPTTVTIQKANFNDPFAFGVSTIILNSSRGFTGSVQLQATSTGPLGLTFSSSIVFLPSNQTMTSILTISASNASPGTYFVTVTGSQFPVGLHHSIMITVEVVTPPPDFDIYLSIPFGSNFVFAGSTTSIQVYLQSNGFSLFQGDVSLTGQASPFVANGPALSFNPNVLSFVHGSSFSQLAISTTTTTPSGNYNITVIGTSGSLVHIAQFQLTVLPPPVISASPSSGPVGTQVTVHGSGFVSRSQGPFAVAELEMTFDDQLVGLFFVQNSSFVFTFNVPVSQSGVMHTIHAKELYPSNLDVQTSFVVLPAPASLSLSVNTGTIYFRGDTAVIFAMTILNGQSSTVSSLKIILVMPNGFNVTLSTVLVSPGLYKATFAVPTTGTLGTYVVIVTAHQTGSGDASALTSFEVKPTWLQSNGGKITTASVIGAVGALGVVALAWRRGYIGNRKNEFPFNEETKA